MRVIVVVTFGLLFFTSTAQADWFCTEAASERRGHHILTCGVATDADEDAARKAALANAFEELDLVCDRSADCRRFELNIAPMRNECVVEEGAYKCYRAVSATITRQRRQEPYRKGGTVQAGIGDTEQLQTLIQALTALAGADQPLPEADECRADTGALRRAWADLTTPARLDALVTEALHIPITIDCWTYHAHLLALFQAHQLSTPRYEAFLLETVGATGTRGHDQRLIDILRYFNRLGAAGERWPVLLEALRHADGPSLEQLQLGVGLESNSRVPREEQRQRFDAILAAASAGQIGRRFPVPQPLPVDEAFSRLLGLANSSRSHSRGWLVAHACGEPFRHVTGSPDYFEEIHRPLLSAYRYGETDQEQRAALHCMAANVNRVSPTEPMGRILVELFQWVEAQIETLDPERAEQRASIERYREDLAEFKRLTAGNLERALGTLPADAGRHNRIAFCVKHGIECAEIMPDVADLRRRLNSRHEERRVATLREIALVPETARLLENEIIEMMLGYSPPYQGRDNAQIRQAVETLMAIPTDDPRALDFIFARILRGHADPGRVASNMGPQLVGRAMAVVEDRARDGLQRRRAAAFLGDVGPPAREAVPLLRAELNERSNDGHLKETIRVSLRQINR